MATEEAVRVFLGAYFTFIAVFYTAKIVAVRNRIGRSPIATVDGRDTQSLPHGLFHVFRAAIWAICVIRIGWHELDEWLVPIDVLWQAPILLTGVALLMAAFGMVVYVHSYMGELWRSGIVEEEGRDLITSGPFARSRNPLFLTVFVAQLGFFLALPSLFSLLCLITGAGMLVIQARIEEEHLRQRLGLRYEAYMARTPRWL